MVEDMILDNTMFLTASLNLEPPELLIITRRHGQNRPVISQWKSTTYVIHLVHPFSRDPSS